MLRRYRRHVAMQPDHWRHPHFRWRCVMTFIVFLRIICSVDLFKKTRIIAISNSMKNKKKIIVFMMTRLLSNITIFLGSSIYCAFRRSSKINAAISKSAINKTMQIYKMKFTLCVLLVYNDNGFVQTLYITRVIALTRCHYKPIHKGWNSFYK